MDSKFKTRNFVPAVADEEAQPVMFADGEDVALNYDYDIFPEVIRAKMIDHALVIRRSFKRWGQSMITIGERLQRAKEDCAGAPKGTYAAWVKAEFNLSPRMAQHMTKVAQRTALLAEKERWHMLPDSALYALAADTTPDEAIEAIFALIEDQEAPVTTTEVEDAIDTARPDRLPAADVQTLIVEALADLGPLVDMTVDWVRSLFPAGKTASAVAIDRAIKNVKREHEQAAPDVVEGTYTVVGETVETPPPIVRPLTADEVTDQLWAILRADHGDKTLEEQWRWLGGQTRREILQRLGKSVTVSGDDLTLGLRNVMASLQAAIDEVEEEQTGFEYLAGEIHELMRQFDSRDGWISEYVELTGDIGSVQSVARALQQMLLTVSPA